jgi:hypothetical protein
MFAGAGQTHSAKCPAKGTNAKAVGLRTIPMDSEGFLMRRVQP